MNTNRITLITLAVSDVGKSVSFYKALGWQIEVQQDEVAFFDTGGQKFGLYSRAKLAEDLGRSENDLGTGAMTLAQNFASPAEVDAAFAHAVEAGATICKAPEKVFWGGYSGTWADPDGHVWEYAHNPFWDLDDQGRIA
ncbi:MAG: VOC family protein [Paracoccaceae bacterium]